MWINLTCTFLAFLRNTATLACNKEWQKCSTVELATSKAHCCLLSFPVCARTCVSFNKVRLRAFNCTLHACMYACVHDFPLTSALCIPLTDHVSWHTHMLKCTQEHMHARTLCLTLSPTMPWVKEWWWWLWCWVGGEMKLCTSFTHSSSFYPLGALSHFPFTLS